MTKPVIMISFFNELNILISITLCIVTVTLTSLAVREFRTILRLLTCSVAIDKLCDQHHQKNHYITYLHYLRLQNPFFHPLPHS